MRLGDRLLSTTLAGILGVSSAWAFVPAELSAYPLEEPGAVLDTYVPSASLRVSRNELDEMSPLTLSWSASNRPTHFILQGHDVGNLERWTGTPRGLGLPPGQHTITVQACNAAGCSVPVSETVFIKRHAQSAGAAR